MSSPTILSLKDMWTHTAFTDVLHIMQASYLKSGPGNSDSENLRVGQGASTFDLMPQKEYMALRSTGWWVNAPVFSPPDGAAVQQSLQSSSEDTVGLSPSCPEGRSQHEFTLYELSAPPCLLPAPSTRLPGINLAHKRLTPKFSSGGLLGEPI